MFKLSGGDTHSQWNGRCPNCGCLWVASAPTDNLCPDCVTPMFFEIIDCVKPMYHVVNWTRVIIPNGDELPVLPNFPPLPTEE
jgi:hypothetical protein